MIQIIKRNSIYVVIALFIATSIIVRIPNNSKYYFNENATYHTLYTIKCYDEVKISDHKFLPIVTLGDEEDKNIPWGATILGNNGNYYYTSFSAAGFILPYLFMKVFFLPINIYSLYAFNSLLYILSFILFSYIMLFHFKKYINSKNIILILCALIYLFQIEIMHSQGVIFWVQSIFQVLFLLQYILFIKSDKSKKCKIGFYLMCLLMPYVEWTGYISNAGFALIIFIKSIIDNKKIDIKTFAKPLLIGILTIASFGLFCLHFISNVDYQVFFNALKERFIVRSFKSELITFPQLLKEYYTSFNYFLVLIFWLFIASLSNRNSRKKLLKCISDLKYPLILFTFILLENVLMKEHAFEYSFDRIKAILILSIFAFIFISSLYKSNEKDNQLFPVFIIIILSTFAAKNLITYKNNYRYYSAPHPEIMDSYKYAKFLKNEFSRENSIIENKDYVRGRMNLLLERGVYEYQTYKSTIEIAKMKNKKYAIFIDSSNETDINKILIKNIQDEKEYIVNIQNDKIVKTET